MITGSDCLLVAGMRMEISALLAENAALKRAERGKTTSNKPSNEIKPCGRCKFKPQCRFHRLCESHCNFFIAV